MTATNRFFDSTGLSATSGTVAKASTINAILSESNTAFELIESELSGLGLGEALSNAWASNLPGDEIDAINYPGIYSSLAYAAEARAYAEGTGGVDTLADGVTLLTYSAKEYMEQSEAARDISVAASATVDDQVDLANEWAENPEDVAVTGYPGEYSALHHSAKATLAQTASETAQGLSETAQGLSEDARDLSQEWAENPEDTAITGYPGSYSSLHHSAKSEDYSIASASSAADALTSEGLANEWAENPEDTAVTGNPGEFSALHWAAKAATTAAGIQDIADDAALAHEWAENPEDVAVTGYPGEYSALHHSAKSEDSAIAASASESNAAGSATLSQQWAAEDEDVIVSGGLYSSLHYSAKSSDSATAAQTAQGLAEAAQGLAETAKTDAETAETGAQTAQGLAETAQGLSEDARDASIVAQGLSEGARDAAVIAKDLAETAETNAETAETGAQTAQGLAETAQGLAETAQANTEAVYDSFDDRYLGPKASDPTLDNDGDALVAGALYFNTGTELMMVWTGSAWIATYADFGAALTAADIQDTPVDGTLDKCISSNWAYDHVAAADPHSGYVLESAAGTAHTRDAEDTLTNGSNLPDGAAITSYVTGYAEPADSTILKEADVDDTPVDSATTAPISSNWAYDHENNSDPVKHMTLLTNADDVNSVSDGWYYWSQTTGVPSNAYGGGGFLYQGEPANDVLFQYMVVTQGPDDVPVGFYRTYLASWSSWIPLITSTPVEGDSYIAISSNWASDHAGAADPHSKLLTSSEDLDDYAFANGKYHWHEGSSPVNAPQGSLEASMTVVMDGTNGVQIVTGSTGAIGKMFIRQFSGGSIWDSWDEFLSRYDVDDTPVNGSTEEPISSNWAYDHTASMAHPQYLAIACSDETSDLAVADNVVTFRAPHAMTLTGVRASVTTAPTGTGITIDITEGGTSILSTLLTIDAASKTSVGATTPAVISDTAIADDAEVSINIDVVGSTAAGAGLKVVFYYTVG